MNYKNVFNKLSFFISNTYTYIKMIRGLPHSGKYSAIAILLIIIFIFITFPYDFLIKKKLYEIEGKGARTISVGAIDFNIIGESYAENLEIVLNNNHELSWKNIIFNPSVNPYRLFIKKRYLADFQFDGFRYSTGETEILMNLNGNIDLIFDTTKNIPVSGQLKIILGDARVKLKEISIPGPMGPFPLKLDLLNIQNGIIEVDIVNSVARIRTFKLTGTDLNCNITGTVELSERTDNSKLDIRINIDPESTALENYKDMIAAVTKNGPLVLTMSGTAGRPDFKIVQPGKENED